jgi:predicted dehydrogenase
MKNIRWGIIGCGDVTEKKSGPAFNKIKNSALLAVMRRNLAKAQDYAQRHQVPESYNNADSIINHPNIDAIYIATPPDSHIEYARKSLENNKAVYIEKPLGINYQECKDFYDFFNKQKQPAWVAYYRRALPYFLRVKEIIDSGVLGKVFHIDIKLHKPPGKNDADKTKPWRVNPEIAGGGYFWDLAPHQIDLLLYYFGKVLQTEGKASNTRWAL